MVLMLARASFPFAFGPSSMMRRPHFAINLMSSGVSTFMTVANAGPLHQPRQGGNLSCRFRTAGTAGVGLLQLGLRVIGR